MPCLAHAPALRAANSPEGTWDFLINGKLRGCAIVTFSNDYTLAGTQLFRPATLKTASTPVDPRDGAPADRGGSSTNSSSSGSSTNSSTTTNVFGGTSLQGYWTYGPSGNVIGILDEVYFLGNELKTNGSSFRAVVSKPGTAAARITLYQYGGNGNSTFTGRPQIALTDLSTPGTFSALGTKQGVPFVELFTLTPDLVFANRYTVTGVGPAYNIAGRAILSRQKYMAFYTVNDSASSVLSSYYGAFNSVTKRGTLNGMDSNGGASTYKIAPRP